MGPTSLSRLAAGTLGAVIVLTVVGVPVGSTPAYLPLLVGAVAMVGLLVAGRLWCRRSFGARVSATVVASGLLVGQALGASVGGPAGEGSQWNPSSAGVVALCAAVLLALVVDSRAGRAPETDRPPYAL
jgi:hypothetical protein